MVYRNLKVIIHNENVIHTALMGFGDFNFRFGKTLLNDLFRFTLAFTQSAKQYFLRRRLNENREGVGHVGFDLNGALHVNFKNHQPALLHRLLDGFTRRAIVISKDIGPFKQLPRVTFLNEIVCSHKVIIHAITIRSSLRTAGDRNAEHPLQLTFHFMRDRRLPHA